MAPFGRTFLKARLKSRSKESEETPGKEIQVLVCGEEKLVCGVTKHTTCADIVKALLEDHKTVAESKRRLHGEPKDFCVLESWKGLERALPPLTRILRLWNAWGDQRPFIQFVLMRISDFVPSSRGAKKNIKSRGARSKRWDQGPAQYAKTVSVEKQRRMVKKAFRKLEKIQRSETPGSEEINTLVRLIISQDQTIRQQIHHMRELDLQIDQVEEQLKKCEDDQPSLMPRCEDQPGDVLYTTDGLEQLENHLLRHQELIHQLSREIHLELRTLRSDSDHPQGAEAACSDLELLEPSLDLTELKDLHHQLESSMRAGLSIHTQTQEIEKELQRNTTALQSQNQEYQHLVSQLEALELEPCSDQPGPVSPSLTPPTVVCFTTDVTDTDSDTGISSTHSQDSLSPGVDRSPPLDTDV